MTINLKKGLQTTSTIGNAVMPQISHGLAKPHTRACSFLGWAGAGWRKLTTFAPYVYMNRWRSGIGKEKVPFEKDKDRAANILTSKRMSLKEFRR